MIGVQWIGRLLKFSKRPTANSANNTKREFHLKRTPAWQKYFRATKQTPATSHPRLMFRACGIGGTLPRESSPAPDERPACARAVGRRSNQRRGRGAG